MSETQNPKPGSRRDFLRITGMALVASAAANKLFNSKAQAQAGAAGAKKDEKPLGMVKPTDPTAQALGYVEDAKKVDVKKFPNKAKPGGEKQFCWNCQFYQSPTDPQKTKAAPCTIFAGKGVAAQGWCNSWVQNPKIKA